MKLSKVATTGCLLSAMVVFPALAMAMDQAPCKAGQTTPESYTWNFPKEASQILKDVRADVTQVQDQADQLNLFAMNPGIDWQAHASELNEIKAEVNDVGAMLCRLETIRRVTLPWQQKAIDRTAVLAREMAFNADQAIRYVNANQGEFWTPTYRNYALNLFNESEKLSQSIGDMEKMARLHKQEQNLHKELSATAGD